MLSAKYVSGNIMRNKKRIYYVEREREREGERKKNY